MIEEMLAKSDSQNLTLSDASAIVEPFSEAGIQPGRAMAEVMDEFGFDARNRGDMAGVGSTRGEGPPPPPSGNGGVQRLNISDEMLQALNELFTEYYGEDQADDQRASTLEPIKAIFRQTMPEGGLVDIKD